VRHITAEHYFLNPVSQTFHGRDVFAPVAASLAKSLQTEAFGEEITDFVRFTLPRPKADGAASAPAGKLKGVVLRVDAFGNLLTNFTPEDLPASVAAEGKIKIQIGNARIENFAPTFAQGKPNEPIALIGSSGFLEIAVNRGNAARTLGANRGAEVTLELA
jgi:S-adenosylmethionine hydrolase